MVIGVKVFERFSALPCEIVSQIHDALNSRMNVAQCLCVLIHVRVDLIEGREKIRGNILFISYAPFFIDWPKPGLFPRIF